MRLRKVVGRKRCQESKIESKVKSKVESRVESTDSIFANSGYGCLIREKNVPTQRSCITDRVDGLGGPILTLGKKEKRSNAAKRSYQ